MSGSIDTTGLGDVPGAVAIPSRARGAPSSTLRSVAAAVAVLAVGLALAVVVLHGLRTSSASMSASTSSDGYLGAAEIVLERPGTASSVLFDATGMYPGRSLAGCTTVDYRGSVPATVRLSARRAGGSGLDEYAHIRLVRLASDTCDGATDGSGDELYDGPLDRLWRERGGFDTGLTVGAGIAPGEVIVIASVVELVDDNRAGGLDTEITFEFEARPT